MINRACTAIFLLCLMAFTAAQAADMNILHKIKPQPQQASPAFEPGGKFLNVWQQKELSGSTDACVEWTDSCRVCQRNSPGTFTCSNVGIACMQTAGRCTRSDKP
jgi:hypothetical protein